MSRPGERGRRGARQVVVDAFTRDLALKLLALLFAVGAWTWVQTERVVEQRVRVRVDYRWPEGLVQVEEPRTSLVATVRGPQGLVRRLDRTRLVLPVDLSDAQEGPVSIDFTERSIQGLPTGIAVVQLSPPAIDLTLDRAMTRTVQVRPAVIGEPAENWRLVSVSVEPDTVEIGGPQSLVRSIAEVSTDIVNIDGLRHDLDKVVPLAIGQRTVRPVGNPEIHVRVDVEPVVAVRTFEEVPVMPRAPGWTASVPTVTVVLSGPAEVVDKMDPERVHVVLHLPRGADGRRPVTLRFDPKADPNPIEVVHPGPAEAVVVRSVSPDHLVLSPAAGEGR